MSFAMARMSHTRLRGHDIQQAHPKKHRAATIAKSSYDLRRRPNEVAINVFQGEREFAQDNRKLAELVFRRYSLNAIGDGRVEVTFLVDADGILSVTAKEVHSLAETRLK